MEKATEIFKKHWTKATGKPLDETTKHHMKYSIEAINEALLLGAVSGSLPLPSDEQIMSWSKEFDETDIKRQAEFRVMAKFMRACMRQ